MSWGILGGGFGLYGYLPALVKSGNAEILILEKHADVIYNRKELFPYLRYVRWVKDIECIMLQATSMAIAVTPLVQEKVIMSLPSGKRYRNILLEKPIATNPVLGQLVLNNAVDHAEAVRIGFSCVYTEWARLLKEKVACQRGAHFKVDWQFMAHHFNMNSDSWKGDSERGGGPLRFYGIHLLALLGQFEGVRIMSSGIHQCGTMQGVIWEADFQSAGNTSISISVNTRSPIECFKISKEEEVIVQMDGPFAGENRFDGEDSRIGVLCKILETFGDSNENYYKLYFDINQLWFEAEALAKSGSR